MTIEDYETHIWTGQSRARYKYEIHEIDAYMETERFKLEEVPGNYIFAKKTIFQYGLPNWTPVYIGQTDDLAGRFDDHEKESCIQENGATHIHVNWDIIKKEDRLKQERDLIAAWDTPCNKQKFLG